MAIAAFLRRVGLRTAILAIGLALVACGGGTLLPLTCPSVRSTFPRQIQREISKIRLDIGCLILLLVILNLSVIGFGDDKC